MHHYSILIILLVLSLITINALAVTGPMRSPTTATPSTKQPETTKNEKSDAQNVKDAQYGAPGYGYGGGYGGGKGYAGQAYGNRYGKNAAVGGHDHLLYRTFYGSGYIDGAPFSGFARIKAHDSDFGSQLSGRVFNNYYRGGAAATRHVAL